MEGKAELFRAKAAECDKKADEATDWEAKRLMREAAQEWRTLAGYADRSGQ